MLYRKAVFADVEAIHKLVNDYAAKGAMLARSRNALYETLRDLVVAEMDGVVVGVGSLHLIWNELAEVRALAIAPELVKMGVGRNIVEKLTEEAKNLGVKMLFTLTYQPGFFAKLGFSVVDKESLPQKVWKECINCPKYPNCDEIAMTKML